MSKDEFIIHEWQKEKMDALVKHNEMEGAKKEGKNIGFEEGSNNKAKEIAKNLLKENIDIQIISKTTGLAKEDIQALENTEN